MEAESQSDIAESFDIEAVPSFILLRVRVVLATVYTTLTVKPTDIRVTLYLDVSVVQMPQLLPKQSRSTLHPPPIALSPIPTKHPEKLPQTW